jgi:hypothetical protein
MGKLTNKETRIISIALASWGLILTGSGYAMDVMTKPKPVVKNDLEIVHKRVAEVKSNEIKLKDIELEINKTLSVDVKDYLENVDEIDAEILKELKLDTSMIKTTEPGTYTYTVTYKKKKYNGTIVIKEKKLPEVDLTINNLSLTIGSPLSTDKQVYIKETLTDEMKENIIIDLTQVDTQKAGKYKYTVTYNGILYTGTIEVYEPQQKVLTPSNGTEDNDKEPKKEETKDPEQTEKSQ